MLPDDLIATTDYGGPLTAMVGDENIAGTQFHPEKSQATGLKLLEIFCAGGHDHLSRHRSEGRRCVRLKKGVMADATVFNTDPAAQAKALQAQGFQWLHCVDLNGAFAGHSANSDAIKAIRAAIDLPIQLGGGIRDMAAVEGWLAAGITRVILGTAALTNPEFVKEAARKFPGRIVVGADAKGGKIATEGWAEV